MAPHSNQQELDEIICRRKLDIEFLMQSVDTQNASFFCIKFIDPATQRFKIIKFSDDNGDGIYKPDGLKNEKVNTLIGTPVGGKFLKRVLNLMTLEFNELY